MYIYEYTGNTAEQYGGAVKANSASSMTATSTIFLGNIADGSLSTSTDAGRGGAIYLSGGTPQLEFHACQLRSNNASNGGGAVFYDAGGGITVNATRLEANWAANWGGGIYARGEVAQV